MRNVFGVGVLSLVLPFSGQGQDASVRQIEDSTKPDYQTVQQGQNFQIHQRVSFQTNQFGKVRAVTNSYTTLGTGMNYLKDGQWLKSKAEIKTNLLGAIAAEGPHKVQFAPDINTQGAIDLMTSDNKRIRSHIFGLAYYDFHLRKSVLIAELKSSIGELVGDNKVIYRDAFTDFRADVEYTYRLDGLEQDVILRERPPLPQEYGFNPVTTRLLVLTEFLDPPVPKLNKKLRKGWKKDEVDRIIDFGAMKIVPGRAFGIGAPPDRFKGVPVTKYWQNLDGRDFLVEEVDFRLIVDQLSKIPERAQANNQKIPNSIRHVVSKDLKMPLRRVAQANSTKQIQVAAVQKQEPGLVLDYAILNVDATNFTFRGDMTYYITNSFVLDGTTTIEGGTVVKFGPNSSAPDSGIIIMGPVDCRTAPYSPAVFTARDDNSVGETISGSTGSPSGIYGTAPLFLEYEAELSNLRCLYAHAGVYSSEPLAISNSQFLHCDYAVQIDSTFTARNLLMSDVDYGFFGHWFHGSIEHLTLDSATYLAYDWAFGYAGDCGGEPTSTISITNSILTAVSSLGTSPVAQDHLANLSSTSGVFQTVGAAAYYLAENSSYRNYGTTNINSDFRLDLAKKTTYPPIIYSNITVMTNITFSRQSQRDTDTPDLGYHYDSLDYLVNTFIVTNATLTITNGCVIAPYDGTGIWMQQNSQIRSEGTPLNPNRFVRYFNVQEQPAVLGPYSHSSASDVNPYHADGLGAVGTFRFTDFDGIGDHLYSFDQWSFSSLSMRDCQAAFGRIWLGGTNIINLQNNLFDRVDVPLQGDPIFTCYNNLFYGDEVWWEKYGSVGNSVNTWTIKDNAFDAPVFFYSDGGGVVDAGYNAYNSTNRIYPTNAADIVLSPFLYETGNLGNFYQPIGSPFINAGSRNATNAGLYHFTTTTNQVKETNTIVDIGFHYVAVGVDGQPIDTNGNGIPDYLEDEEGTGQLFSVVLLTPVNNAILAEPATTSIKAKVVDWRNIVTNVSFFSGTTNLINTSTGPPQFTWPLVPAGQYTLTAVARNTAGTSATSAPVNITVTNLCTNP